MKLNNYFANETLKSNIMECVINFCEDNSMPLDSEMIEYANGYVDDMINTHIPDTDVFNDEEQEPKEVLEEVVGNMMISIMQLITAASSFRTALEHIAKSMENKNE